MHKFLAIALALALAGCAAAQRHPAPAGAAGFRILQVNDTYKIEGLENGRIGGLARLRTLRKQLEAQGLPVLVLHAGDLLFPSVMSKYLKGGPMVKMLNLLDGDAAAFDPNLIVALGNHEFDDQDPGVLLGRMAQSDFTWLATNVGYRTGAAAPGEAFGQRVERVKDGVVRELNGVKVGLFSLTLDVAQPDYVAYRYRPEAARRALVAESIAKLRQQGARVIVALTHQNLEDDIWLAREFPDINLVAGGHEHFYTQQSVGNTWITKADADNRSAVVHDVNVAADGAVSIVPHKVELGDAVVPDPYVSNAVQAQQAELVKSVRKAGGEDLTREVGKTAHWLEGEETAVRGRETALGNLLADVIRQRMDTDIAWINGGSIRINDNIPPGPITHYHVAGIFYYDDDLVAMALTGAQIVDVLRNSVSKVHNGDGRFLHVSGLRFRYHVGGTAESPLYSIEAGDVEVLGKGGKYVPLRLDKTYRVGSSDFLWGRGVEDGYALFAAGKGGSSPQRIDSGKPVGQRQAFLEAIARLPRRTVTSRVEGRIVRMDKQH